MKERVATVAFGVLIVGMGLSALAAIFDPTPLPVSTETAGGTIVDSSIGFPYGPVWIVDDYVEMVVDSEHFRPPHYVFVKFYVGDIGTECLRAIYTPTLTSERCYRANNFVIDGWATIPVPVGGPLQRITVERENGEVIVPPVCLTDLRRIAQ